MSVSPVVQLQMLMQYHNYKENGARTFKFVRNNRMRVHKETEEETSARRSVLNENVRKMAENAVRSNLMESLKGRIGKVWVDPMMKNIAVPLQMSSANGGVEVLPTGSHVKIPEGKKIRAFTYWEKVNDIDLSAFLLSEDGEFEEFSWRTMWDRNNDEIIFSGDETSGYYGGSEYFDIVLDKFARSNSGYRYLVFCDNIYSNDVRFKDCFCRAGFMIRDEEDSGEIFEPKTVRTSYVVDGNSTFTYLFAIDLQKREMIWLNLVREGDYSVAGNTNMSFLLDYMTMTDVFSIYDLFCAMGEPVATVEEAEVIVADLPFGVAEGVIRPCDVEKVLKYIQA